MFTLARMMTMRSTVPEINKEQLVLKDDSPKKFPVLRHVKLRVRYVWIYMMVLIVSSIML